MDDSDPLIDLFRQADDILMICALRFDGYKVLDKRGWDDHAAFVTWTQTGNWKHLTLLRRFALFFRLQRVLFKWGGERLPRWSDEWRALYSLFFLLCRTPVPPGYELDDFSERWAREYAPRLEECIALVQASAAQAEAQRPAEPEISTD